MYVFYGINMSEVIKTRLSFETSGYILKAAENLVGLFSEEELLINPNRLAFVLTISAFVEARLNEAIIHWGEIGSEIIEGNRHAKAFLSMNLRAKMDSIFFLVSGGEYVTNTYCKEYQELSRLIKIRNEVAHSTPFHSEIDIEYKDYEDFAGAKSFKLSSEFIERNTLKAFKMEKGELEYFLKSAESLSEALGYESEFFDSVWCVSVNKGSHA